MTGVAASPVAAIRDVVVWPRDGTMAGVVRAVACFSEQSTLVVDAVDNRDDVASGFGVAYGDGTLRCTMMPSELLMHSCPSSMA